MTGTNNPLVSILIPAFNAAPYLAETLDSLIRQNYQNFEVILVVDEKSTDHTIEIANKYLSLLKLKVIKQKDFRSNASMNRNLAFRYAQGELIKFLDADDILSEEHIRLQVNKSLKHTNCIVAGECCRFYQNDIKKTRYEPLANWKDLPPIEWLFIDNGKGIGMMQPGIFLIPRKIIEEAGLWDESLSLLDDFEYMPRLIFKSELVLHCEKAILYYRSGNSSSLSAQLSQEHFTSAFRALSKTTNLILSMDEKENIKKVLAKFWRLWSYSFYPDQLNYYQIAEKRIIELGGSPHYFGNGISSHLNSVIGWKTVKKLKRLYSNFFIRKSL